MTALNAFDRLEASGLWRPSANEQRREVIVSIGDATLVISDLNDQALAHWSLAAVERSGTTSKGVSYHPNGDPEETLELAASEVTMIEAIEKLRQAVARARPRPGRLRLFSVLLSCAVVAALALFWLPGAMLRHTVSVVPAVNRAAIGQALLARIERMSGPACRDRDGIAALTKLGNRVQANDLYVLRAGVQDSLHLPGNIILLNRALIEDFEEPDVAAGHVISEQVRAATKDPLEALLEASGIAANFRLITTGTLTNETLDDYATYVLTEKRSDTSQEALLTRFEQLGVRSTPYAYGRDITGESVLGLIEADPMRGVETQPLMNDADWIRLQNICGG